MLKNGTTATQKACVYCAWQARSMVAHVCCAGWISRTVASLRGSCKKKCSWFFRVCMRPAPISIRKNPKIATAVLESGSTRGSPSYGKDQPSPQAGEQIEQGTSPPEPCGKRSRPSCEDREQLSIPIGSERLRKMACPSLDTLQRYFQKRDSPAAWLWVLARAPIRACCDIVAGADW